MFTGKLPVADQDPNVIDAELRKRARLFSARHLVNLHKHIALRALPDTAVRASSDRLIGVAIEVIGHHRRYVDDDDIGYRRPAAGLCARSEALGIRRQRVARSFPERWPAVPAARETCFAMTVQGRQLAHREGQPGRCPFLIGRKWG